jgi:hypothetical protein
MSKIVPASVSLNSALCKKITEGWSKVNSGVGLCLK